MVLFTDIKDHISKISKYIENRKLNELKNILRKTDKIVFHFFYDEELDGHYWKRITLINQFELDEYKCIWDLEYSTRVIEKEHEYFLNYLSADKISRRIEQKGIGGMTWGIDYRGFLYNYNRLSTYEYCKNR